jgi:putative heme transporter
LARTDTVTRVNSKRSGSDDVTRLVPRGLRVAAALAWRFLLVVGALYVVVWIAGFFASVLIPVAVALLLSALMAPAVSRLVAWRVPRALATVVVLIGGIAVVGGVLTFVITEFISGLPDLQVQISHSLETIKTWLLQGPLHLRQEQIQGFLNNIIQTINANSSAITSSAITTAATLGEVLAALLLTLFILIFFLYDGAGIWRFLVRGVPEIARDRVDIAGRRGFASLVSYVRATAAVAVVDAVGIGIGIWIVGVPLVVPLAALVFLGAFVPIVGAVVAGTVAVLVALVANGLVAALVVLAILIGVMQLEGHVLQPWLLGRAVKLHPLAVVIAIAAGLVASGIAGALLAVPLLAVVNAGVRSLLRHETASPESVHVLDGAHPVGDPGTEPETDPGTDGATPGPTTDESDLPGKP